MSDELTGAQAFRRQFDSNSLLLRTNMPAQVVGVDLANNTVDVQPVLKGMMVGATESYLLPVINGVQVQFYGAGDLWVVFEPKIGSYCVLSVSDRSIEAWKKAGGIIDPKLNRHHDMSDSFAYFGVNPLPDAIQNIEPDTMHIRTRDGSTGIKVKADAITYDVNGVEVLEMTSSLAEFKVDIKAPDATISGKLFSTHKHDGSPTAATGAKSDTGVPIA